MRRRIPKIDLCAVKEIAARKHDTAFQVQLCSEMMGRSEILPYPFHRAVILLTKERRYGEALAICNYVDEWCRESEREHDGVSAMVWLSPVLREILARKQKLEAAAKALQTVNHKESPT